MPLYPFFGTLFDGLKFSSDYRPEGKSDAIRQEAFLFYFLVSLLFIVESYIWFNGFDSFLRNYLNSQYSLPPTVELRALLIGILVVIVLFNGLKLLFLLMLPFSKAASLIVSIFNQRSEQPQESRPSATKSLKELLVNARFETEKAVVGSLVNIIQITFAGVLFYLVSGGPAAGGSASRACGAGAGLIETIVCLRDEILSKQLPCVSMLILLITLVFAGAFAAVEIGLFRADFGPEFEETPSVKIPLGSKVLVIALIAGGILTVGAVGIYLQHQFLLMVAVTILYLTIALIIVIWSAVRFGLKGTIGYYLRILTIFISILITGFSLDVVFYNEPIDHLFKLYESASIADRMKVKLRQLGDIPPDPAQAPSTSRVHARHGALWKHIEGCIGKIATDRPSPAVADKDRKKIINEETRNEVFGRTKKLKIAIRKFSSEGMSPLTCYKDYYADKDQYYATLALLHIGDIFRSPSLNSELDLTKECALGGKYEYWRKEQLAGATNLKTLRDGFGEKTIKTYMSAIAKDDRDVYCSQFRDEIIKCFKDDQFLQLVQLHEYITASLPETEVKTRAALEDPCDKKPKDEPQTAANPPKGAENGSKREPHLVWEWTAKDCRALAASSCDPQKNAAPAAAGTGQASGTNQHSALDCMLYEEELCIRRYPSLVERNRYKELYMKLATYERVPVRIEAGSPAEIDEIREDINRKKKDIASLVFAKTEALVALLASLLQVLVIISKLIVSPSLYKKIQNAYTDAAKDEEAATPAETGKPPADRGDRADPEDKSDAAM